MDTSQPVSSGKQFEEILKSQALTGALRKVLDSGPQVNEGRRDRSRPNLAEDLYDFIFKNAFRGDEEVYKGLRQIVHGKMKYENGEEHAPNSSGPAYNINVLNKAKLSKRGLSRAKETRGLLPRYFEPDSLLDLGCAEGSITQYLMEVFRTDRDNTYAADVTPTTTGEFTFFQIHEKQSDGKYLGRLRDSSISLVVAFQAWHHFTRIPEMIREVYRILEPGGFLVIREHDCDTKGFSMVLDVMHGLYAMVWSNPMEDPTWRSTFAAQYKSRNTWRALFESHGLKHYLKPGVKEDAVEGNHCRFYYDLFQKPKSDRGDENGNFSLKGTSNGPRKEVPEERYRNDPREDFGRNRPQPSSPPLRRSRDRRDSWDRDSRDRRDSWDRDSRDPRSERRDPRDREFRERDPRDRDSRVRDERRGFERRDYDERRDSRDFRDPRSREDSGRKPISPPYRDSRDRDPRDRDPWRERDYEEGRRYRDSRDSRDYEPRSPRDPRDYERRYRDSRDSRDARDYEEINRRPRDPRDDRRYRDSRDPRDYEPRSPGGPRDRPPRDGNFEVDRRCSTSDKRPPDSRGKNAPSDDARPRIKGLIGKGWRKVTPEEDEMYPPWR